MDNLNYGVIGNGRSAALVSTCGSIDWCCLPEFDSSSAFAKILDENSGGSFGFDVDDSYEITQKYILQTNVLLTRFESSDGAFEVIDFMPRYFNGNNKHHNPPDIVRYIRWVFGQPKFRVNYNPKLNYAKNDTKSKIEGNYIKSVTSRGVYDSLYLYTSLDKNDILEKNEVTATKDEFFLVSYNQKILKQNVERTYLKMERTKVYWLNWVEKLVKFKKYNDEIIRSSLVLKLLS